MSITLPHDMVAMVEAKVTSGEYASESEVMGHLRTAYRERMARTKL